MKYKNLLLLVAGLAAGLTIGYYIASTAATTSNPSIPAAVAATESGSVTPAPDPAAASDPISVALSLPEWDQSAVYNGGDRVAYGGRVYQAKWWTQGEPPDKADVWEDTLEAAPAALQNAPTPAPLPLAEPVPKPEGFKVVGYFPSWKPTKTNLPRYDVLTHVIYAFAIPTSEGGLRPLENPDTAQTILRDAHANGVKVLLAVGGWSYNDVPLEPTFVSATETPGKRAAFVEAIVSMCDSYGFDGVDIDWEHPRVDGASHQQYEDLMLELAQRLHGEGKLLTSAVLSGATADGNIYYDAAAHTDKVLEAVDWINVMAYDGGDGERHSPYAFAVNCATYWKDTRGMSAGKVVLGLSFYGRPSWAGYGDILAAAPDAWRGDTANYNGMTAWYNGPQTIRDKTRYAMEHLGGVMIWELTQDTAEPEKSLQSAIGAELEAG